MVNSVKGSAMFSFSIDDAFVYDMGAEKGDKWSRDSYFGIPDISHDFNRLASDLSYAKKQKEKPQSFVGNWEFLSNMHLCTIEVAEDEIYPSVENAFQAMKCRTKAERKAFMGITPQEAKKLGKDVVLRSNWEEMRVPIMKKLLALKFTQNDELAIELLKTEDQPLCELNYWGDSFWGKCPVTHKEEKIIDEETGAKVVMQKTKIEGQNMLGKLLCEVRESIRNGHVFDAYFGAYGEQADVNVDWIGK